VKQFRDGEVEPAAIAQAHEAWSNVMGSATETPHGLAANLSLLLAGPQRNGRSNGHVSKVPAGESRLASLRRFMARHANDDAEGSMNNGAATIRPGVRPTYTPLPAEGRP
jgi:hypothetical protein